MGIWAIMGVQFFADDFPDEFGNFGKAMLSLFQITTFDSWVSGITRPIILHYAFKNRESIIHEFVFLYFFSYCFMSAIIMLNVVVAILLDKFISAAESVKEAKVCEKWQQQSI